MDYDELQTNLKALGVVPPDVCRASLYYGYLTAAKTYFCTTLAASAANGGLEDGYGFVQNAVRSASVLNELAKLLDHFLAPAVNADIQDQFTNGGHGGANGWTYRQYFDNVILNQNYAQNVAGFFGRYPIADHAMKKLAANFQGNIKLCCERVIDDRADLEVFYEDRYPHKFEIDRLTQIKSTGSDFHKGGKQVLILTFSCTQTTVVGEDAESSTFDLKVVYKPGDIEADCLIAGDSAAVNRVTSGFMTSSLFEILNARLAVVKNGDSAFKGLPLKTYRLLPREYNSKHGVQLPLPIPDSYGYIEYLNYDAQWPASGFWGWFQSPASGYLIFDHQDSGAIIDEFYLQAGEICALASSFSLLDLHIENVRVADYQPCLIDMEVSLTTGVEEIGATSLLGAMFAGLQTETVYGQEFHWKVDDADKPGKAYIGREYDFVYEANRLYTWSGSSAPGSPALLKAGRKLVPVDNPSLLTGFEDGMRVLREAQQNGEFNAWFTRLNNNVVVRYLPFATSDFKKVVTKVFIEQFDKDPGAQLQPVLDGALLAKRSEEFSNYTAGALPDFLAFVDTQSEPDYQNLDIPVFYRRIGANSLDIVNSRGDAVPIADKVQVDQGSPPQPTDVDTNIGRQTFFPNEPTANAVRAPQVTVLGQQGYDARLQGLLSSICEALGVQRAPDPQPAVPHG